jgi:hypothetical protein
MVSCHNAGCPVNWPHSAAAMRLQGMPPGLWALLEAPAVALAGSCCWGGGAVGLAQLEEPPMGPPPAACSAATGARLAGRGVESGRACSRVIAWTGSCYKYPACEQQAARGLKLVLDNTPFFQAMVRTHLPLPSGSRGLSLQSAQVWKLVAGGVSQGSLQPSCSLFKGGTFPLCGRCKNKHKMPFPPAASSPPKPASAVNILQVPASNPPVGTAAPLQAAARQVCLAGSVPIETPWAWSAAAANPAPAAAQLPPCAGPPLPALLVSSPPAGKAHLSEALGPLKHV